MSHVEEHCRTPRTWRKQLGSLWACTCGQVFQLRNETMSSIQFGYKRWVRVDLVLREE